MSYPATAVLAPVGPGTATLQRPSGFGEAFGEAFGGYVTNVTATLASDGVGTAGVEEVLVSAELQLV